MIRLSIIWSALRLGLTVSAKRLQVLAGRFFPVLFRKDTVAAQDIIAIGVAAEKQDAVSISANDVQVEFGKIVSDSASTVNDEAYFAEDYAAEEYTFPGLVQLGVYKVLEDISHVSESSVVFVGKVLVEAVGSSSSGVLWMQNYAVDSTYFAEDYVGMSQAF